MPAAHRARRPDSSAPARTWLQDLLINGEAFPLGTDEKYVGRLDETIDRLNADRSRGVKKLRTAKKQSGQATAAESIAAAHKRAGARPAGSQ